MRFLFALFLVTNFAFANYSIYFTGIKLGETNSFETLKENYLQAEITNSIAKLLLGKDTFIFYDEEFNLPMNKDKIKYKKDKNAIIHILKRAISNDLKDNEKIIINENKYIEVKKDDIYTFKYISDKKLKSEGSFKIENGVLQNFIESKSDIKILINK